MGGEKNEAAPASAEFGILLGVLSARCFCLRRAAFANSEEQLLNQPLSKRPEERLTRRVKQVRSFGSFSCP